MACMSFEEAGAVCTISRRVKSLSDAMFIAESESVVLLVGDLLYWDAFSSSERTHMVYLTALGLRCRGVMYDNNDVMR
eukprot:3573761-Prymnesium_polylepis.1